MERKTEKNCQNSFTIIGINGMVKKHARSAVCCWTRVFFTSFNVSISKQRFLNKIMIQWLRLSVFALFVPMYVYNRDLLSLLSYYHNKIYLSLIFIRINRVCKEPNRNSNLQICLSFQNHKSLCVPQNSDICQIQNSFSKFQNS